ncbi:MAG: PilT/PilU family type 4a pilus ATPase [Deltaproteobacteria bacterium]
MNVEQLNQLLEMGFKSGASDVHLKAGNPPAFRINGKLQYLQADRLTPTAARQVCLHLMREPKHRDRIDEIQELDTSYSLAGIGRFRVNIYRQRGSLSAILRIIPSDVPNLEQLGLPPQTVQLANEERGMILVTGASGSGKSTTLASLVHHINHTRNTHIVTVEDPIEYLHKNAQSSISQREIGIDTANYHVALRAALRQDPDVIVVGEIRDQEAVDIALKASETGHVVFSTIHTTDAPKTIGRLLSMFPSNEEDSVRMRLAENLRGTISQRLLPRADGRGRIVAVELMFVTKTVQQYIRDPARTAGLREVLEKGRTQYGMQTFDQHLIELHRSGYITIEVAMSAASNPSDFERSLHFS